MKKIFIRSLILAVPAFLLYTWLVIFPTINAFRYSLYDWVGFGKKTFLGFQNFARLFQDSYFHLAMKNTCIYVLIGTIGLVGLGFLLSLVVQNTTKAKSLFKTVFFLPVVVSAVAVGLLWRFIYNPDFGILDSLLKILGLKSLIQDWLGNPRIVLYSVLVPVVWQYCGLYMMIYYAGLQSIPASLHEAASIDGANSFQRFFRITIPLLKEVSLICLILSSTGLLRIFDHVWVMTQGGPNHASDLLSIFMWNEAFTVFKAGKAMAVAVIMFFMSVAISIGFRTLVGRAEEIY